MHSIDAIGKYSETCHMQPQADGVFTLTEIQANTEIDKKRLYRIVWRCSYCSMTDINTDSRWVLRLSYGVFTLTVTDTETETKTDKMRSDSDNLSWRFLLVSGSVSMSV